MHAQVRHARFNLWLIGITLLLTGVSFAAIYASKGLTVAWASFGFCGILGLLGLGGRFYKKRPGQPEIVMDERDKQINSKATLIAWGATWIYWGTACMGPWFYAAAKHGFGTDGLLAVSVPVMLLPMAYMAGFIVHVAAWSLAILHHYAREAE
jgi:hypothetical protein